MEKQEEVKNEVVRSPFIGEDSTFDVEIKYYLDEKIGGKGTFIVQNVHDNFVDSDKCSSFKVTLRIPSQRDCVAMNSRQRKSPKIESEIDTFRAFSEMEYFRLLILVKEWTLERPCTEENINQLHPSFVKGIVAAIRNEIGMDSIV